MCHSKVFYNLKDTNFNDWFLILTLNLKTKVGLFPQVQVLSKKLNTAKEASNNNIKQSSSSE